MKSKDLFFRFILSIFVLLGNHIDAIATYFALQKEGNYETNNDMQCIIKKLG